MSTRNWDLHSFCCCCCKRQPQPRPVGRRPPGSPQISECSINSLNWVVEFNSFSSFIYPLYLMAGKNPNLRLSLSLVFFAVAAPPVYLVVVAAAPLPLRSCAGHVHRMIYSGNIYPISRHYIKDGVTESARVSCGNTTHGIKLHCRLYNQNIPRCAGHVHLRLGTCCCRSSVH